MPPQGSRQNPENSPPRASNEGWNTDDLREKAKEAREEYRRKLGEAAIRAAQAREKLYGRPQAAEETEPQASDEQTPPRRPQGADDDTSADNTAEEEAARQQAAEEAERQRQEAERQQQEEAERRQREAAEERRREAERREAERRRQRQETERQRAEQQRREQEAERQRQGAAHDPETLAQVESLLPGLVRLNPELRMFDDHEVKYVIACILAKRSAGTTDWSIHLAFHPDKQPGRPSANQDFQISSKLLRGNGKNARYSI